MSPRPHIIKFSCRPASALSFVGLLAGLLGLLLLAPSAAGMVYAPLDDETLLRQAPVVAVAQVAALTPADDATTEVHLHVEQRLKGAIDEDAILVLPTGRDASGVLRRWSGTPRLRAGDRVLLFLEPLDDARHRLVHHGLGAFVLVSAEDGRQVAVRALGDALAVAGRATVASEPTRDFERFARWIERRADGRPAAIDYRLPPSTTHPARVDAALKYRRVLSSTEPSPFGCGADGGLPMRVALIDGASFAWRNYLLGQPSLDQGGASALRVALDAWTDDPSSDIELRHIGLAVSTRGLTRTDQSNTVAFEDPHDQIAGRYEDGGVVAVTVQWYECDHHQYRGRTYHPIVEADIVFQDGLDDLFAIADDPERLAEQLLGRELGQALGFALSNDPSALLAPTPHDDLRGALLAPDDLRALADTYGDGAVPTPRGRPEALRAELVPGGVVLLWQDGVDGESLLHVERRQVGTDDDGSGDDGSGDDSAAFEPVGGAPADTTEFLDLRAQSGRSYEYRLVPVSAGGRGSASSVLRVDVPIGGGLPAAPSNLRGAALAPTRALLTWRDNACAESEQQLHVLQNGTWVEVPFRIPADLERVVVEGLEPERQYSFRLVARNIYGESATSKVAQVTTPATDAACQPDAATLCLLDGRFAVRATIETPVRGRRAARAAPADDSAGSFWLFHADNLELTVDLLDERPTSGHFAVRYGVLTSLGFEITVTDTETGAVRVYDDAAGMACGGEDVDAFPVPLTLPATATPIRAKNSAKNSAKSATACFLNSNELSLHDGRFLLNMEFRDAGGRRVKARALDATRDAGHFSFVSDDSAPEPPIDWSVKILDGRAVNDAYWIFHGPVGAAIEAWLTIDDLSDGSRRVYHRPADTGCSQIDLDAFPDG